jgi:flagellar hook-associated protein 2
MSQFSVSGAVSGLDTASLINSLMQVEGQQQQVLTTKQTAAKSAADAYGKLITSLNGLSDQAKAVARTSAWAGSTATSSSTSVGVKATGSSAASLTFDVTQVAAAHAVISAESVASTTAHVAAGAVTLTRSDGTSTSIDTGDGSLAAVVSGINNAKLGLTATAVQTGAGAIRLQVVANSTGADTGFTLDGLDGFTGMNVLTQAADARITVGSNPATAYQVSSASNTFDKLVGGLSFTVSKVESGVTVASQVDGSTVADNVSKLVDTANSVLSTLASQSAHATGANTSAGPLSGESAVRSLTQRILNTVSGAGAPGVSLTRDGKLSFDRTKFLTAFSADPAAVARAYGATASLTPAGGVTGTVELAGSGDTTKAGNYSVSVSAAALREQWQLDPPGAIVAGRTIVVQRGSTTISYTAGATESLADVIAALGSRLSRAGFGVTPSDNGGSLMLTADSAGAAQAFTANIDGAGFRLTAGQDVAGTIDGQAATGSGNLLSLRTGTGGAVGLSLRVAVSDTDVAATGGAIGTVGYKPGLAQGLVSVIQSATASSGSLTTAQEGRQTEVDDLQKQIDNWTTRLDAKRLSLQKQFTAMETTLASLKSQTSALSGLSTSSSTSSTG